jgi:hypothetical protein
MQEQARELIVLDLKTLYGETAKLNELSVYLTKALDGR